MIVLLILACGSTSPAGTAAPLVAQSPEALEIEAVVTAWNERDDLPALDAERLRAMLVLDARTEAEYRQWCPDSRECLAHRYPRFMGPGVAIAVIRPGYSRGSRLSLIRHSAVHRAAELGGISDPLHTSRKLWGYHCQQDLACRAPTVEERARSIANAR